jgi:tetratricopeptide (TPR) repeat protein
MQIKTSNKNRILFLWLFLFKTTLSQTTLPTEFKTAADFFLKENYIEAYPIYKDLHKKYPENIQYTYRLGVCSIFALEKKEQSLPLLEQAVNNSEVEKEAHFYLGWAYMLNYKYDKAIKQFDSYRKKATNDEMLRYKVKRHIEMCENAKKIKPNIKDWRIYDKKVVEKNNYLQLYDTSFFRGKLKIKPDDFFYKTYLDFESNQKLSTVFISEDSSKIFIGSYGLEDEDKNLDIYIIRRLPNLDWGLAEKLPNTINTPYDEDFPIIHPDGNTLFFSSKGHTSMGGYDIFKSVYDSVSGLWSEPKNMGVPINSPDDDFLFVTDTSGKKAIYTTAQNTKGDELSIFFLRKQTKEDSVVFVKAIATDVQGSPVNIEMSLVDAENCTTKAIYKNNKQSGKYNMILTKGTNYLVRIKSPNMKPRYSLMQINPETEEKTIEQHLIFDNQNDYLYFKVLDSVSTDPFIMNKFISNTMYCVETKKENFFVPVAENGLDKPYYKINPVISIGLQSKAESRSLPSFETDLEQNDKNKMIYSVQVGLYSKKVSPSVFFNIQPLYHYQRSDGKYAYYSGIFDSYIKADEARNVIRQIGVTDAFIVAFKGGKQISVSGNPKDLNKTKELSRQNLAYQIYPLPSDKALFYTLQIGVYALYNPKPLNIDLNPIFFQKREDNKFYYSVGIYTSIDIAKKAKEKVLSYGVQNAFITAVFNSNKITIAESLENNSIPILTSHPNINQMPYIKSSAGD